MQARFFSTPFRSPNCVGPVAWWDWRQKGRCYAFDCWGDNLCVRTSVTKRILKAHQAGVVIVREAEERATDMILVANSPTRIRRTAQQIDPAVEYVMKNAPCETLILSQG